jgi:prepilin-type N-terminal cleavage/methylation domain-containing protein
MHSRRSGFTLIELLVVIAIIAILAVVVVLTLNPAELLRQSRDSNRLSDMATVQNALNIYSTDQVGTPGFSLGNASSVYLSLPDTSNICANLGLSTTSPSGINYACASSTSSRNINGSGWIPVNLASTTAGSPLSSLPIDPINQSSTGLYYSYYTNGTQYEATALFESSKYKTQTSQKPIIQNYPEMDAVGSSLTINPLFNPSGLVGYWPMDEGSGSTSGVSQAQDKSGNNNNGTWYGTAGGSNSTYYTGGKVGGYAGMFDGSSTYIMLPSVATIMPSLSSGLTMCAWIKSPGLSTGMTSGAVISLGFDVNLYVVSGGQLVVYDITKGAVSSATSLFDNNFHNVCATYDGTYARLYSDGVLGTSTATAWPLAWAYPAINLIIGFNQNNPAVTRFNGSIDDVRIYNRALSAAEIQALYNAGR